MAEKTQKQKTGGLGEGEAAQYLVNKGYKIIERNHRQKWGDEIDIVAQDREGILVFVEVKAIRKFGISELMPEDNLNFNKLRKLKRLCQFYANSHRDLVNDGGWRIDLVAVDMLKNDFTFRHYENI